ncbi:MAG: DUF4177 domain-containing protein [Gaiella sp.]|nr:DUF4177 domain-containing protein [Gaiella sp.]
MGTTERAIEHVPSPGGATDGNGADDLVTALLPSRTVREPAPGMWEYRSELLEHGFLGWGKEQVDLHKLQDRLEALGAEGWELVNVSWNHRVRRRHGGHLLIFKRSKP